MVAKAAKSEKIRRWRSRRTRVQKGMRTSDRVALTIYRSNKHIYAQLVDRTTGRTLTSVSTRDVDLRGDGSGATVEAAKRVGEAIATKAREHRIDEVVFNRNGFLYHGRVKALADAAREAGLNF
jgi:large subunit ribosomal protein L18